MLWKFSLLGYLNWEKEKNWIQTKNKLQKNLKNALSRLDTEKFVASYWINFFFLKNHFLWLEIFSCLRFRRKIPPRYKQLCKLRTVSRIAGCTIKYSFKVSYFNCPFLLFLRARRLASWQIHHKITQWARLCCSKESSIRKS